MDKCKQCNMNFENVCDFYGGISCKDAIMFCDTDEFLQYPPNDEDEDNTSFPKIGRSGLFAS